MNLKKLTDINTLIKNTTKAVSIGIIILSGFLFAGVFILIVAKWIVDYSFTEYDNSTISGLYANSITNTTIALVTVAYVLLTGIIVTQSKKEQQIRDIENRLDKFYIPAEEIINNSSINKNHKDTINGFQPANYDGLKHLKKYSYLANKTTFEAYETYIKSNCTELKPITCQDKYKNFNFNECEKYTSGCHYDWPKCPKNLDYCKYYKECPPKDQSNV